VSPISTAARAEWSRRLARALVAGGFVSESVVATYLVQATENNIPLSVILIQRHGELRDVVLNTLGQLARMRVVDLEAEPPMGEIRHLLPPMLALEYRAIPLRVSGNQVITAFAEPPEPEDVAALAGILGHDVVAVLANPVIVDRMVQPAEAHAANGSASARAPGHASPISDHSAVFEMFPSVDEEAMPRHARVDDPPVPPPVNAVLSPMSPPPEPVVASVAASAPDLFEAAPNRRRRRHRRHRHRHRRRPRSSPWSRSWAGWRRHLRRPGPSSVTLARSTLRTSSDHPRSPRRSADRRRSAVAGPTTWGSVSTSTTCSVTW
jgi:hypothetical protein